MHLHLEDSTAQAAWRLRVGPLTIKDMFQTLSLVGSCSYKYTLEFTHSILRWAGCEPPFTGDAEL